MRLVTFSYSGSDVLIGAYLHNNQYVLDFQTAVRARKGSDLPCFANMLAFIEEGDKALQIAHDLLENPPSDAILNAADITLLAPLPVPQQIRSFSVFELHGKQSLVGMQRLIADITGESLKPPFKPEDVPTPQWWIEKAIYYKANRFSVTGPNTDITWPFFSKVIDFELELAAIIGRKGTDITPEKASSHIFGFTICNDLSARDVQIDELALPFGPSKSKDFNGGNVLGPCIVTCDEIPDPYNLTMTAIVNGEEWGKGNSAAMQHRFEDMITQVSRSETLYPGEVFLSGCVGNGCGLEQNRFPKKGDTIELEIEKIGRTANKII